MEKELTAAVTTQEPMLADSLIVVQQLPVIKEQQIVLEKLEQLKGDLDGGEVQSE